MKQYAILVCCSMNGTPVMYVIEEFVTAYSAKREATKIREELPGLPYTIVIDRAA